MEIISVQDKYNEPLVLCLGFFDCMHLGHVRLLRAAKTIAAKNGAKLALFTFQNNHFETLKRPTKLIYTYNERLALYDSLGVDVVVSACFDENFRAQSGKQFLSQLAANFRLQGVVCGQDFTCGSDLLGACDVQKFFEGTCAVKVARLVKTTDGNKISSTYIRQLLVETHIQRANKYLSQPFHFVGAVVEGRHVGHTLGFPTANMEIPTEKLAPLGVYAGMAEVDGVTYKAVVNVGNTPTFNVDKQLVEAHLLDFQSYLYGKTIKVSLLKYLRPIQDFHSEQALITQLQQDISCARQGR